MPTTLSKEQAQQILEQIYANATPDDQIDTSDIPVIEGPNLVWPRSEHAKWAPIVENIARIHREATKRAVAQAVQAATAKQAVAE